MLIQAGENFVCKKSDVIISLLGNAKEHLIEHGMHPDKFYHITNGFDRDEYMNCKETLPFEYKELLTSFKNQNKFIIGYTGGINPSDALITWIKAAQLLNNFDEIVFMCVGTGSDLCRLQKLQKEYHLSNVYFLKPVSKKTIPSLLAYFDIVYVGFISSILPKYGIAPNKMVDYMLSGKPIILSADVENSIVDRVSCGITIPAEDPKALVDTIHKLQEMPIYELQEMGKRGREYALKELDYEILSRKFIQILNQIPEQLQ
jgi:glycosyltransferase involved in cell wall biosynthesis